MELLARIPKDRIAVLIGKAGRTRKMLEKASGASLEIDSATGDVLAIYISRASGTSSAYIYLSLNVIMEKS